jgi:YHS domain-containing protein
MEVDETLSREHGLTADYQGKTYYFCTDDCKGKFVKNPGSYTGKPISAKATVVSPAAHTE